MSAGGVIKALRALGNLSVTEVPTMVASNVRPVPYLGPWPIRSHRTIAEVDAAEGAR